MENKNLSILKKAAITITLALGLLIAFYGLFAFILVSSDQANYFTQGSNLGKINYDEVISNAQKAGYKVDGPYFVNVKKELGVHPPGIKELDEWFGGTIDLYQLDIFIAKKSIFQQNKMKAPQIYSSLMKIDPMNHLRQSIFHQMNGSLKSSC